MRRILLLGLAAALAFVLAPAARAASTNQIIRDCEDDGVLEGHYTAAELRKALRHLPTDVAEYSNCTDVLSRAADAAASGPSAPSHSGGGPTGSATPTATPSGDSSGNVKPSTPQDTLALQAAARSRPPAIAVSGRRVAGLTPTLGRNSLPSSLLVVLLLLAAGALAGAAPFVRRVVRRRRG